MTIEEFCTLVRESELRRLVSWGTDCELNRDQAHPIVRKPGKKYTKVDIGRPGADYASGKYMIVNETGDVYGIKAYGVIHKGKHYGNLNTEVHLPY